MAFCRLPVWSKGDAQNQGLVAILQDNLIKLV